MKQIVIASAFSLATGGLLSAQGLYNIMPFDDEPEDSLPLNWTVGASIGWDSNASPLFTELPGVDTDEVMYTSAFVQANWVSKTPQTTLDLWGRVGALYYLDDIDSTGGGLPGTRVEDNFFPQFRGGVNFVHRVNECLRLRSRNSLVYEQEPDYDYGIATDRRTGSYVRFSSDNSAGYRWTERFGTNTGYRINGVVFDEVDNEDYVQHLFYNQFRYRTAPSTVWTASYRYQYQSNDDRDSNSHYFLVGAEHEVGPTTVVVLRAGGQYFDPDGSDSRWSPYLEGTLRTALSETVSFRVFVRYAIEDRSRMLITGNFPTLFRSSYGERQVFRLGSQGSWIISPKLTAFAGVNAIVYNYDELDTARSAPGSPGDFEETIFNVNVGASYEVYDNLFVTGSVNFTNSSSDSDTRDYDRTRAQLGVQAAF